MLRSAEQTVKLAPKWADARYWYGFAIEGSQFLGQQPNRYQLTKAKSAYERAIELDRGLAASCHLALAIIAKRQGQKQQTLEQLDQFFVLRPDLAANNAGLRNWRERVASQLAQINN